MDIQCGLIVGGVNIILVALGYGYKIHADKRHIKLEKKDYEHEAKHHHNEERIKELEKRLEAEQKKNGHQQRQIDILKKEMEKLKKT